jgi:mRNA-degrading endonuclease RelE of RelBE toxin-antitoxin system
MAITPQVAIAKSFLTALNRLPDSQRKKVNEFITKFGENPTSAAINFESLQNMRDPNVRTVRIDIKYRAVVIHPPKGNVYLLVWVDNHDEAMAWAKNKIFDINAATGALQVLDMEYVEKAATIVEAKTKQAGPPGLFAALSDEDLARTGLPTVLVPAVRAVIAEDTFEKLQPYLPREAFEALYMVAAGYELESAIRESSRPQPVETKKVDTEDFTAALRRPASRAEFHLVESEAELLEMLNASLDTWRVFLHPNQEAIVHTNFRGPARVLGGAGTGKTVVAMHRIRHLAKAIFPGEKLLFTTFNRNLAANISELLDSLCGPERKNIEVANIHAWALGYAGKHWGSFKFVDPSQVDILWDTALGAGGPALGWTRSDYKDEWMEVVQFHGVSTRDEYFKVSRTGAKKKLKRPERAKIWDGLAAYRAELDKGGLVDWPDLIRKVRQHIEASGIHPYRAVVVDEAQDIDAEQWRLLRVLAPTADNDLFITGDAHQRIYGKPIALSQFDINIQGRSRRLKINYRTTEQILRWATGLLVGSEIDDLDGGSDSAVGYHSLYSGPEPDVHYFKPDGMEADFLIKRIKELTVDTPPEEIAVIAKYKGRVRSYAQFLEDAGIPNSVLDGDGNSGPGIRIATMNRVKGLEFSHVIMQIPESMNSTDPRDKSLLYVAATRCRKTLTVMRTT